MTISALFSPEKPLRVGTRRSPLAMAQAQMAAAAIREHAGLPEAAVMLVPMLATGDKILDRPLAEVGGKALWTKELERALVEGDIDIAVHSMKDVETVRPQQYHIAAMLPRADVRDRLIGADDITALPEGAHIGTSSPRRAAQLLALRPDLRISSIRGNVATRLAQIQAGDFDATLLAAAGLDRLDQGDTGSNIAIDQMLPAASQGAIGIECLADSAEIRDLLAGINHSKNYDCVMAERAFLKALGGTCHSPVAALAIMQAGEIWLRGEILREDGSERQAGDIRFDAGEDGAPQKLAEELLSAASTELKALFNP
jgi:hydroxymethylbilane synthase